MAKPEPLVELHAFQRPIPLIFFGAEDDGTDRFGEGALYNPRILSFLRDEWISRQIQLREREFTEYRTLRLFVGSWNVNAKVPDEDLSPWLTEEMGSAAHLPDIYVVGLQEMVDLNAANVALSSGQSGRRARDWEERILRCVNAAWERERSEGITTTADIAGERFRVVRTEILVGVFITVLAKKKLVPHIGDVQCTTAAVGLMGVMVRDRQKTWPNCMPVILRAYSLCDGGRVLLHSWQGNKGAASVRMRVYDSSLCFVCAHLAAHRENVAGRNANYASIMQKTEFQQPSSSSDGMDGRSSPGAESRQRASTDGSHNAFISSDVLAVGPRKILHHEFVIWFGDLNYRINSMLPTDRVMELAADQSNESLAILRQHDQLVHERAAERAFHGFEEGPLAFPPTYKFEPGTAQYDQRPDKKVRAPAWCDRILWRVTRDPRHIQLLYYGSAPLTASDHHPVHGLFDVAIRTTISEKKEAVYCDILRQLGDLEQRERPQMEVDALSVDFGEIAFGVPVMRTLTLRNPGNVMAPFRFVPKPEQFAFTPPWLVVDPPLGMVPPGQSVELTLCACVSVAVARDVSMGRHELDEILILRLEGGQDFFVSVVAHALPSAYGASLPQLLRQQAPFRSIRPPAEEMTEADNAAASDTTLAIPKELWRLMDGLYADGNEAGVSRLRTPGLFQTPGPTADLAKIRECLDTGEPFPSDLNPLSLAEGVVDFLAALREPVIPCGFFPGLDLSPAMVPDWCRQLLAHLPPSHFNTLAYVLTFARELLDPSFRDNGLDANVLARVLGRCCARPIPHDEAAAHSRWPRIETTDEAASGRVRHRAASEGGTAIQHAALTMGQPANAVGGSLLWGTPFADEGTRWEPSEDEMKVLGSIFHYFLTVPSLPM